MKDLWDLGTISRTIQRIERSNQGNRTFEVQDQGQITKLIDQLSKHTIDLAVTAVRITKSGILPRYYCEAELQRGELLELIQPRNPPINHLYLAHTARNIRLPL